MCAIEINVSKSAEQERCAIAAALVRNGYRVCLMVKKSENVKKTFLVVDQAQEATAK